LLIDNFLFSHDLNFKKYHKYKTGQVQHKGMNHSSSSRNLKLFSSATFFWK